MRTSFYAGTAVGVSGRLLANHTMSVVTAILIRATQLLGGGQRICSDGSWEEWHNARKSVKQLFQYDEIVCPWGKDEE